MEVETVEICYMPEPLYRLVIGLDSRGERKAVWIDTDVRFVVDLSEGISCSEVLEIARNRGFTEPMYIHLIYRPSEGGQVLWRVTDAPSEAPSNHELWLNFYDGTRFAFQVFRPPLTGIYKV